MFTFLMDKRKWKKLACLIISFTLIGVFTFFYLRSVVYTDTIAQGNLQIVLDPGHGGVDGGAVGRSGVIEKDINLSIALKARDMLVDKGYSVVMTRETDISIHSEDADTVKKQKTSDLKNRLSIIEQNPDSITISIHQNKFGNASASGTRVYYSPNNPQSQVLANILQEQFREYLNSKDEYETRAAGSNLFILYNATTPTILAECGFLSNAEEEALLNTEDYQVKIAASLCAAIDAYVETQEMKE